VTFALSVLLLAFGAAGIILSRGFGSTAGGSGVGNMATNRKALLDYRIPDNPYSHLAVNLCELDEFDRASDAISKLTDPIDKLTTISLCIEYCLPKDYFVIAETSQTDQSGLSFSRPVKSSKLDHESEKFLLSLCKDCQDLQSHLLADPELLSPSDDASNPRYKLSTSCEAIMVMFVPSESNTIEMGNPLLDNFAKLYEKQLAIEKQDFDNQRHAEERVEFWQSIYKICLAIGSFLGFLSLKLLDPFVKAASEVASRNVASGLASNSELFGQINKELTGKPGRKE
jgi:hypothetical protein